MSITTKLSEIQQHLKAPKSQYNKFGQYKYRNVEDILEAVKPLLGDCVIVITDEIHFVSEQRIYVKATAVISDGEASLSSTAYAREPATRKGMDESQITITATSYARKTALGGLLLIDDSAHQADAGDNTETDRITDDQAKQIHALIDENELDKDKFLQWLKKAMKADDIESISSQSHEAVISQINRSIKAREKRNANNK